MLTEFKVALFSARLSSFLTVVRSDPPARTFEEILEKGIDFMIPGKKCSFIGLIYNKVIYYMSAPQERAPSRTALRMHPLDP